MIAALPSPPFDAFHVGPLTVHMYGLCYIAAIAAAIRLTAARWGDRDLVVDVALWSVPGGLIGARLYSVATSWSDVVPPHWWGPFAIWEGGLSIWGGIIGGVAVGLWRLHRADADIPRFMDAVAPGLLVAQAIGRIGNYFNQELFGGPTDLPWGLRIAPQYRPAGYEQFTTFHPTFLYEMLVNLALAGGLILLGRTGRVRAPGLFALYVTGYSGFRIVEELLRVDPSRHVFGMRLNFFVALVLAVGGLVWFVAIQGWRPVRTGIVLLVLGSTTIAFSACGSGGPAHAAVPPATGDGRTVDIADIRVQAPSMPVAPGLGGPAPAPRRSRLAPDVMPSGRG